MKKIYYLTIIAAGLSTFALTSSAQTNQKTDMLKEFVPANYEIIEAASGDMNKDGFADYALVLASKNEEVDGYESRPLLLIIGNKNGSVLAARNDSVVLCRSCGGMFGDPFKSISIGENILTIDNNVGNSLRYSRSISFRYDNELKEFVLDSDIEQRFRQSDENRQLMAEAKKDEGKKMLFQSFSFTKRN